MLKTRISCHCSGPKASALFALAGSTALPMIRQVWKEYPGRSFVTDYNTYSLDEQKYRNFLKEVKQKGLPAETIDAEMRMTKILIAQPIDKKTLLKEVKKYAKMPRADKQIVDYYNKLSEM